MPAVSFFPSIFAAVQQSFCRLASVRTATRALIVALSLPLLAVASDQDWTMIARTPLGDPVLINRNQLDRNGAVLIRTLDPASRDRIFARAIREFEGDTKAPPSDAILRSEAGASSPFVRWLYDTNADRRFAERVIRMGGERFAASIETQLGHTDPMIRIEMLRIVLQSQGEIRLSPGALEARLKDPIADVQTLALMVLARDPARSPLTAAAARVAFARNKDDVSACLGLQILKDQPPTPESRDGAWRLLGSMATNPMAQINLSSLTGLNVPWQSCNLTTVLQRLTAVTEADRIDGNRKLTEFLATHPTMEAPLASAVDANPALGAEWSAVFLPYWRRQVSAYLATADAAPIGVLFPRYLSVASALEGSRSSDDAALLLRLATHQAPYDGQLLRRAIEALATSGGLRGQGVAVTSALTQFIAQRARTNGELTTDDADVIKALSNHAADLATDDATIESLWVLFSSLKVKAAPLAGELGGAIEEQNTELSRAMLDRHPGFNQLAEPDACQRSAYRRQEEAFLLAYQRQDYAGARTLLEPIMRCEQSPRNDMAVTLHHLGDDAGCLTVLKPLLSLAKTPESEMPQSPRDYWDRQRRLARQTRTNLRLCGYGGELPQP